MGTGGRRTLAGFVAVAALLGGASHAEDVVVDGAAAVAGTAAATRRVVVTLAVEGQLFGPATAAADPGRQAIGMEATLEFVDTPQAGRATAAAVRRYTEATATLDLDGETRTVSLPADARVVSVARLGTTPQPFLPDACLSRDEIDLLETPFDSILLDDLLPGRPVAVGDRWSLAGDLTAGLLAIDTVENGTIEARIVEFADGVARIGLEGVVEGAIDGVPTHVVVDGSCAVAAEPDEDGHVLVGDVTRLDVVVKERRQASHVAAGFDIEARLAVTRTPECAGQGENGAADVADEGSATVGGQRRRGRGGPGLVWYRDPEGRYDLVHDAAWRCVGEDAGGLILRLLDFGALVAQCSITALPRAEDVAAPSVDEVKQHVEQSLAGQFRRFSAATERVREADGVRVVRVESEGTAAGLPFQWVHYVLTDDHGRRMHATFMCEASLAKRFADADARLVEGLRFAAEPHREARLPPKTTEP